MATVLKKFYFAADGVTVESMEPGVERDFGAAQAGLEAEGYVGAAASVAEPEIESEPSVESVVEEPATEPVVTADPAPVVAEPEPAAPVAAPARRSRGG